MFSRFKFVLIKRDLRTASYKRDDKTRKIKTPYAHIYTFTPNTDLYQFNRIIKRICQV
jgi:hypothetical protein